MKISSKTQDPIRESEEKFRIIFEQSTIGKSLTLPDGKLACVNNAFAAMVGRTIEQMEQVNFAAITHPDDIAESKECIRSLLANERSTYRMEKRYRHSNGSYIWTDVSTSLLRDGKGTPINFITSISDISDRKRTEAALHESEKKYRELFQNSEVGMYRSKVDGSAILAVNRKLCEIFGYSESEMIENPATIRWAYPDARTEMVESLRKNGFLHDYEIDILTKTGKIRNLSISVNLFPVQGYLEGSAIDITERKQTDKLLHETNEYLENLFRYANAPIIVWDTHYNITKFNPAFELLTGRKSEEVVGNTIEILFPTALVSHSMEFIKQAQAGERWETVEIDIQHIEGSIKTVLWNSAVMLDADGKTIIATIAQGQEITRRKIAEEKIKRLNEELEDRVALRTAQLEASNKELEAFSYSVSHDLRAPLRHVSGYVELLNNRFMADLPEKGQHYLKSISDSVHTMGTLIDNLLQFSKTGRIEMCQSFFDMNAIVEEITDFLSKDNPNREIEWIREKLPAVYGDEEMLKLVWTNLLGNAIKFTRTRTLARIEVGVREEGSMLVFFVRDNGVGFDMQYAHKLFGVFQRLHPTEEFEGTGIGLANVQRIIIRLGGQTWAEAEPDKGAVFYFSLPKK